ncbi:MAG TPA: hypothetical protein VIS07_04245 [Candidatus Binatia bacterium]
MTRKIVGALAAVLLLVGSASAEDAASKGGKKERVSCKDIRQAMSSGKTADQVASELGTRTKRVERCMGREPRTKKKGTQAGQADGSATPAKEKSTTP